MIVVKFGGTSVGDAEAIERAAALRRTARHASGGSVSPWRTTNALSLLAPAAKVISSVRCAVWRICAIGTSAMREAPRRSPVANYVAVSDSILESLRLSLSPVVLGDKTALFELSPRSGACLIAPVSSFFSDGASR